MPHDIIMPALGMTQDSGKLVAWLKQPGDAVNTGDPIMEVETDKATMEVEAQSDGFLTDVTAAAGDDVPVGQVVGRISATTQDAETPTPKAAADASEPDTLPDGKTVIMPALGMAQDSGLIVSWRKAAGDAVKADDVLLEVETDKSVMEVEAGHDGYLAAILANAQQAVPVGSVIAVISAQKPEKPVQRSAVSAPTPAVEPSDAPPSGQQTRMETQPAVRATQQEAAPHPGGRILASPKARRIALEEGLDLARLSEHGVAQPFHVADLELLRALSVSAAKPAASAAPAESPAPSAAMHIQARIPAAGCDEFIRWMAEDGHIELKPWFVWLRFAASALRKVTGLETDDLIVESTAPKQATRRFANPDRARLSEPREDESDTKPSLILRDLSATLLTEVQLPASDAPVLTIGRHRDDMSIGLDFTAAHFSEDDAVEFVTDFAERMQEPLRHIV
tara:strand:+ start:23208 stop:24560 length:1353 start_codon:yes stop_codon:yes gene_type:complete